jgi:peptidoglycan/LPS O-acetylase OafA/YrhL
MFKHPAFDPWNKPQYPQWYDSGFITFSKFVFVFGAMLFLFSLSELVPSFPKWIQKNPVVQWFANLGFSYYLWHYMILDLRVWGQSAQTYNTDYIVIGGWMGDLFMTTGLAFWSTMVCENTGVMLWKLWVEGPFLKHFRK